MFVPSMWMQAFDGVTTALELEGGNLPITEAYAVAQNEGRPLNYGYSASWAAARMLPDVVPMLREAQRRGLRITVEAYPYGARSTVIGAQLFDPAALDVQGINEKDIFYVPTQRRIESRQELIDARRENPAGTAVIFFLDEEKEEQRAVLDLAVLYPDAAIASDTIWWVRRNGKPVVEPVWPLPEDAYAHPRSAGSCTRLLGRYVRERKQLSLMEAIRKASLLPAQIIEDAAPQMTTKGRIRLGADADIIVFDPDTVIDRATYANPRQPAEGMGHVIVSGVPIIRDGKLDTAVMPGKPVRGPVGREPIESKTAERTILESDVMATILELRAASALR